MLFILNFEHELARNVFFKQFQYKNGKSIEQNQKNIFTIY